MPASMLDRPLSAGISTVTAHPRRAARTLLLVGLALLTAAVVAGGAWWLLAAAVGMPAAAAGWGLEVRRLAVRAGRTGR